ncbi:MAG: tetratricopeptide repeat protein, partial [Aureispira sp.]
GELDNAIYAYNKALDIKPDDTEIHHSLAWTYLLQTQLPKAQQHFLQTWELSNKKHTHAPMNLGHCALLQKQPQQALEWYQKSIPLWEDITIFWQGMEQDYLDLNMQQQGILPADYQALLTQLKASLEPNNKK